MGPTGVLQSAQSVQELAQAREWERAVKRATHLFRFLDHEIDHLADDARLSAEEGAYL